MFAPYSNDNNLVIDTRDYPNNRGRLFQLRHSSRLGMAGVISKYKLLKTRVSSTTVGSKFMVRPYLGQKQPAYSQRKLTKLTPF